MKVVGVIPARFASTRFPGKPLALILGKPLIEHVYLRAKACSTLAGIIVATEDERILLFCKGAGIPVVMTSAKHQSGTDRTAEVARKVLADAYVNIQGDEPLVSPTAIAKLVSTALRRKAEVATLITPLPRDDRDLANPNVVKVVRNRKGYALFFSRYPIPYPRNKENADYFQHVGVYFFKREALLKFARLKPTPLELAEGLEQLRLLENNVQVLTVVDKYRPISVDTPEDIRRVEEELKKRGNEA